MRGGNGEGKGVVLPIVSTMPVNMVEDGVGVSRTGTVGCCWAMVTMVG